MNPRLLAFGHDFLACVVAWVAAFWLRFNLSPPADVIQEVGRTVIWVAPLQACIFLAIGLYRGIWRYASIPDLKRIFGAVLAAALSIPVLVYFLRLQAQIPRSVLILDPVLLMGFMCGSRLAYRTWKEYVRYGAARRVGEPVLIFGAGDAAFNLVKELSRSQEWNVVGLLDDDPRKAGRLLNGAKVIGKLTDAPELAAALNVKRAIIAMPSETPAARRRANDACVNAGLSVLTVPAFDDLVSGRVAVSQIRKIEVEDLLGRQPVMLDTAGLKEMLAGKIVMVTGAGGSIGSELCRQIARYEPSLLVFFELSELALYQIEQEFTRAFPHIAIVNISGDVKDSKRLSNVMSEYRPSIVFHAAAYKHVPLMEKRNAWEAVRNNALGTYVAAKASLMHGVNRFVLISTDKAVNPVNVMGATKRLAEMICQALQQSHATRFTVVRFGNVLGSNGSVIPKFHEQIANGGPVTVTHPSIVRYFMSIPEAAQLVLQAGAMGLGGEIFVMDMGDPVKILDLARDMIRLSGFTEEEIPVVFTGLRPGEKLFEELLANDEHTFATPHPKLRIARARNTDAIWLEDLLQWFDSAGSREDEQVRQGLKRWIPEYSFTSVPELRLVQPAKNRVAPEHSM